MDFFFFSDIEWWIMGLMFKMGISLLSAIAQGYNSSLKII